MLQLRKIAGISRLKNEKSEKLTNSQTLSVWEVVNFLDFSS